MLSHSNPHFDSDDVVAAIDFLQRTVLGTLVVNDEVRQLRSLQSPWTVGPAAGGALTLISHVPRRSRLSDKLARVGTVLVIFVGEHGYISPSWFPADGRRSAPTWNYEILEVAGQVSLLSDEALCDHLQVLSQSAEKAIDGDWSLGAMGSRFDILRAEIIGISLAVDRWEYRRKLGQDERQADFDGCLAGLERLGRKSLSDRMRGVRYTLSEAE